MSELRPIPGFEGIYSITADGRVWAHERKTKHNSAQGYQIRKPKWLRSFPYGNYLGVSLFDLSCSSDHGRLHYIHQLVIAAWGPPRPSPEHEVNHKDLNKLNNHIDNLEWVTRSGNLQHARAQGHYSPPPRNDLIWITNGANNRLIKLYEAIPIGWQRGVTRQAATAVTPVLRLPIRRPS